MKASLVLGELVAAPASTAPLPCPTPGVAARQSTRKGAGVLVEERLYGCANGLALAARRGGPLHLADADTWEVMTMTADRVCIGKPAGWITEKQLARLVELLAAWRVSPAVST